MAATQRSNPRASAVQATSARCMSRRSGCTNEVIAMSIHDSTMVPSQSSSGTPDWAARKRRLRNAVRAVSYTHLDVYKRQVKALPFEIGRAHV